MPPSLSLPQVSFLLRIPDNSRLDGSRAFSLHLTELTGGAVLGPQSAAIVTIADDDQNKTSPWLSYPAGDGLAKVGTAGQTNNLTIFAVSFSGRQQAVGGDFFLVSIENPDDQQVCHHSPTSLHSVIRAIYSRSVPRSAPRCLVVTGCCAVVVVRRQLPEGGQARVAFTDGQCGDRGNGSYPCTWTVKQKGEETCAVG